MLFLVIVKTAKLCSRKKTPLYIQQHVPVGIVCRRYLKKQSHTVTQDHAELDAKYLST